MDEGALLDRAAAAEPEDLCAGFGSDHLRGLVLRVEDEEVFWSLAFGDPGLGRGVALEGSVAV